MKTTLFALALVASLAGCGKKTDPTPTPDPFLGHWVSETLRHVQYDASGKVTSDQTTPAVTQMDVTATTITITSTDANGSTSKEVDPYTRNGESIKLSPPNGAGQETTFIRGLTAAGFTFEFDGAYTQGKYVETIPYHR